MKKKREHETEGQIKNRKLLDFNPKIKVVTTSTLIFLNISNEIHQLQVS